MCEACDNDSGSVEVIIEFPASGATYEYEEYGVYAYDEYPQGSVNEGMQRRRNRGRYEKLEEAQREHPKAEWAGEGSAWIELDIPLSPPGWFDPSYAGESWDAE